jgi:quinol monooxygenase YgiN
VADIARPIVNNAGGLRFRVAQSVEPELQPQLSYAHRSPQDFQKSMEQLQALLATQPNTDGVVVQAWNDLMSMGYENQIR